MKYSILEQTYKPVTFSELEAINILSESEIEPSEKYLTGTFLVNGETLKGVEYTKLSQEGYIPDFKKIIDRLNLSTGIYKVEFENTTELATSTKIRVKAVSPDAREILTSLTTEISLTENLTPGQRFLRTENSTYEIYNEVIFNGTVAFRLDRGFQEPLNTLIRVFNREVDKVEWILQVEQELEQGQTVNLLPNFKLTPKPLQQVESYTIQRLEPQVMYADYSDFSKFVHFSTATARVKALLRKFEILENLQQIISLTPSGSYPLSQSIQKVQERIQTTVNSFDGYEYTNYYISSSYGFPKQIKEGTQIPQSVFTSESQRWITESLSKASEYDNGNLNSLRTQLPPYVQSLPNGEELYKFFDLLGHYYDNLRLYNVALNGRNHLESVEGKQIPSSEIVKSLDDKASYFPYGYSLDDVYPTSSYGDIKTTQIPETSLYRDLFKIISQRVAAHGTFLTRQKGTHEYYEHLANILGFPIETLNQSRIVTGELNNPQLKFSKKVYIDKTPGVVIPTNTLKADINAINFRISTETPEIQSGEKYLLLVGSISGNNTVSQSLADPIKVNTTSSFYGVSLEKVDTSGPYLSFQNQIKVQYFQSGSTSLELILDADLYPELNITVVQQTGFQSLIATGYNTLTCEVLRNWITGSQGTSFLNLGNSFIYGPTGSISINNTTYKAYPGKTQGIKLYNTPVDLLQELELNSTQTFVEDVTRNPWSQSTRVGSYLSASLLADIPVGLTVEIQRPTASVHSAMLNGDYSVAFKAVGNTVRYLQTASIEGTDYTIKGSRNGQMMPNVGYSNIEVTLEQLDQGAEIHTLSEYEKTGERVHGKDGREKEYVTRKHTVGLSPTYIRDLEISDKLTPFEISKLEYNPLDFDQVLRISTLNIIDSWLDTRMEFNNLVRILEQLSPGVYQSWKKSEGLRLVKNLEPTFENSIYKLYPELTTSLEVEDKVTGKTDIPSQAKGTPLTYNNIPASHEKREQVITPVGILTNIDKTKTEIVTGNYAGGLIVPVKNGEVGQIYEKKLTLLYEANLYTVLPFSSQDETAPVTEMDFLSDQNIPLTGEFLLYW